MAMLWENKKDQFNAGAAKGSFAEHNQNVKEFRLAHPRIEPEKGNRDILKLIDIITIHVIPILPRNWQN